MLRSIIQWTCWTIRADYKIFCAYAHLNEWVKSTNNQMSHFSKIESLHTFNHYHSSWMCLWTKKNKDRNVKLHLTGFMLAMNVRNSDKENKIIVLMAIHTTRRCHGRLEVWTRTVCLPLIKSNYLIICLWWYFLVHCSCKCLFIFVGLFVVSFFYWTILPFKIMQSKWKNTNNNNSNNSYVWIVSAKTRLNWLQYDMIDDNFSLSVHGTAWWNWYIGNISNVCQSIYVQIICSTFLRHNLSYWIFYLYSKICLYNSC